MANYFQIVKDIDVVVAPDQATCSKFRGNIAKVKVEIDLLKPRLDQILLGFKWFDGTDDGKWLDIEYDKVVRYCLYCKMQGHYESQCKNKIRDERTKAQKGFQISKEKDQDHRKENDKEKKDDF